MDMLRNPISFPSLSFLFPMMRIERDSEKAHKTLS